MPFPPTEEPLNTVASNFAGAAAADSAEATESSTLPTETEILANCPAIAQFIESRSAIGFQFLPIRVNVVPGNPRFFQIELNYSRSDYPTKNGQINQLGCKEFTIQLPEFWVIQNIPEKLISSANTADNTKNFALSQMPSLAESTRQFAREVKNLVQ